MADSDEESSPQAAPYRVIGAFYLIAFSVLALDQAVKLLVLTTLRIGHETPILGSLISLNLRHNYGAAWGLMAAHTRWLTCIAVVLVVVLLAGGRWAPRMPGHLRTGLPLLLGGALGNLADRLRFGYVVEFIDLHFWPVFNLADIAIVAAAAVICYHVISEERAAAHRDADGSKASTDESEAAAKDHPCDQC